MVWGRIAHKPALENKQGVCIAPRYELDAELTRVDCVYKIFGPPYLAGGIAAVVPVKEAYGDSVLSSALNSEICLRRPGEHGRVGAVLWMKRRRPETVWKDERQDAALKARSFGAAVVEADIFFGIAVLIHLSAELPRLAYPFDDLRSRGRDG